MIEFYYWPTPNGHKVSIMLEEIGLAYTVHPVNILKGEQFTPEFLKISPNNKMPAIVDTDGPNGQPYAIFESGSILMYLAEKVGKFWPLDMEERYNVLQWLMFQIANVGPMFGQNGYFQGYADEDVPHAKNRYLAETKRLYSVMDKRLANNDYLAGNTYSIADIATYPWTIPPQNTFHRIDITDYPHVDQWVRRISERPAVQRGLALLKEDQMIGDATDETREVFFGRRQMKQR
jgi:GST-like protein